MRVTRARAARLPQLRGGRARPAAGLAVVAGPNGAGKTNLLEARLLRLHRQRRRAPRTSASWSAAARAVARVVIDPADEDGGAPHRGRVPTRRGQAPARRRQRREQPVDTRRAPARERLHAGAARAREGRSVGPAGASRPVRRRPLARSRRRAQRLLAGARPAQRPARPDPRRGWPAPPRSTPGTPSWRARGLR